MVDNEKRCRKCNFTLHNSNWSNARKKKNDYICSVCKSEELKSIVVETSRVQKTGWSIERLGRKSPVITTLPTAQVSIRDMIGSTETFRIEQVMKLVTSGNEDKVRKVSIDYLIKVSDLLTVEQLAKVINEANSMMLQAGVDDEIKLKVAITLRNFMSAKDGKSEKTKSFEELLKGEQGEIDIDNEI